MSDIGSASAAAFICPLCKGYNACANSTAASHKQECWCKNPNLQFPQALLEQVPEEMRGKACICQACVAAYSKNLSREL